jgi:hypothetical protein
MHSKIQRIVKIDPQNMMGREDIRMVKNAFKDPKNCQN